MTIDGEVKKFLGLPPYDGSGNICKEDPLFLSITMQYLRGETSSKSNKSHKERK